VYKAKKTSVHSTKSRKEPVLLQYLVEADRSSMVYQLSMRVQSLCIVFCLYQRFNLVGAYEMHYYIPMVLNRGARLPSGASSKFQGSASLYVLYNMESSINKFASTYMYFCNSFKAKGFETNNN